MTSTWFIQFKGVVYGPFAVEQLQAMAATGQVHAATLASRDRIGWITAGQIPGLVFAQPALVPVIAVPMSLAPVSVVPADSIAADSAENVALVNVVPVSVVPVSLAPVNVVPVAEGPVSMAPVAPVTVAPVTAVPATVVGGIAESAADVVATADIPAATVFESSHAQPTLGEIAPAGIPPTSRLSRAVRRQGAQENDWLLKAGAIGGGLAALVALIIYFSSGNGPRETALRPELAKASPHSPATSVRASASSAADGLADRDAARGRTAPLNDRRAAPRIGLDEMEDAELAAPRTVKADGAVAAVSTASIPDPPAATPNVPADQPMPADEPADDEAHADHNEDHKAGTAGSGKQLLAAFRRTKSAQKRDEITDQVLKLDDAVVEQFLAAVNQEIRGQLRAYNKRVAAVSRSKVGAQIGAEVEQLRAQIIEVRDRQDLTKEMIVDEVDPALAKLNSFLLNGSMLIDRSPNLQKQRQGLLQLGNYWERCVNRLAESHLAETLPEESKAAHPPANFESYLQNEENMILEPAALPQQARAILATNSVLAERLDAEEARAVLACNMTRCLVGLVPLSIDPRLCAAARDHSHDMENLGFFSHQSSVPGKQDPWARAKNFETTASGENIFMGVADGSVAHQGWMHSPGHFKNLLGDHVRIGLGRSGAYFTQIFGK